MKHNENEVDLWGKLKGNPVEMMENLVEFNEIKDSLQEGYDNRNLFSSIPMYKSMPEDKKVATFVDKIAHGANFTFHEDEHQH